ncbi:MAG: adenylate/guanylate cyclase domain-containing protein [Candidatus Cloacimonetes bacterium]|nr:adenylate/guanylate cyclase domain-containing protein [Candidatus Cloacimonadota bacterium]
MSYYKLQSIFFLTLFSVYLIITQISYRVYDHQSFTKASNYFKNIVQEKEEMLQGLRNDEEFAHYPNKLKIIETTTNPFLLKVSELTKQKNWKSKVSSLEIPFKDQSCLVIGKNGRKSFKSGVSMDDIFTSGWDKSIFIALKYQKTMFSRMNAIYHHPVDIRDFKLYFQKFQLLYHKDKQYVYKYYTKINNIDVFYFLKLNKIQNVHLKHIIQSFFIDSDQRLSISGDDSIIWNNNPLIINKNLTGLKYTPKSIGYVDYLKTLSIANYVFVLLVALLYYKGGYRVITSYFEFKFILIYLFFIYLLFLLFVQVFTDLKENRRTLSKQQLEKHWTKSLRNLEQDYYRYKENLTKEILFNFHNNNVFNSKVWNHRIYGIVGKKGYNRLSSKQIDPLNKHIINSFISYLSSQSKSFPLKSTDLNELANYFNIKRNINNGILATLSSEKDLVVKNKEVFVNQTNGEFIKIPIVGDTLEVLFDYKGVQDSFEALLVKSTVRDLQNIFFKQFDQSDISASILIKSKSSRSFNSFNFKKSISSQEFQGIQSRFLNRMGGLNKFKRENINYFAMFLKSDVFENYDIFFIKPELEVYKSISQMHSDFKSFLWVFYFVILIIPVLLSRLILKPIHQLKRGLLKVKRDVLSPMKNIKGKDESADLLHNFNSMVTELQRKREMLPFVSNAVFEILTDDQGTIETEYSGNAVVLFSDIKSFTSISETRDPQEVVDMLNEYFTIWQEKIERNGGIVDRFIGDAISVVYFEKSSPHFVQQAIQTSVEVMEALEKFNEQRKEAGEFIIENGVGLCYGEVYFSMVGDQNKMEFLIQGKPVALSEYLEGQSRYSNHSHIILDPYIKDQVNYQYDFAPFEVEDKSFGTFYELVL